MKTSIIYPILLVLLFLLPVKNVNGKSFSEFIIEDIEQTSVVLVHINKLSNNQMDIKGHITSIYILPTIHFVSDNVCNLTQKAIIGVIERYHK